MELEMLICIYWWGVTGIGQIHNTYKKDEKLNLCILLYVGCWKP